MKSETSAKSPFREKCVNNLKYGGINEEEYREIEDEILEKNRSSLEMISFILFMMFAGLFTGSLFSEIMASNRIAYATLGLCFLGILFLSRLMKKRGKRAVVPLWYVAITVMLVYAAVLNTVVRNDISSTTLCLIIIVAPILILDKPWRVFLYFTVMMLLFIPVDFHQKIYYLAFTDMVNILCCLFLGSVIHFGIIRTKLREMMQRRFIERQRDTDKLTGCLTKAAFEQRIIQRMASGEISGTFLIMDVDRFKSINDSYGHTFGDMVLHTVGEKLCRVSPSTALCGRFGGDEFVVWIPGKIGRKETLIFLTELVDQIHSIRTPDDHIQITASIGVAGAPENGDKYSELFENADAALYSAKKLGRDRFIFCPGIQMEKEVS